MVSRWGSMGPRLSGDSMGPRLSGLWDLLYFPRVVTHRERVKECASQRKEKKRGMKRGGDGTSFQPDFVQIEAKTNRVGGACCPQGAVAQASSHPPHFCCLQMFRTPPY